MEFSIQYPSDWKVDNLTKDEVNFRVAYKPLVNGSFDVTVKEPIPYLDTETLALKNTTLEQYIQAELNTFNSSDKHLFRQNVVTIAGNTGYKIEYTTKYKYVFEIYTSANEKFYILTYREDPLKVPETLPIADKMVESFQTKR